MSVASGVNMSRLWTLRPHIDNWGKLSFPHKSRLYNVQSTMYTVECRSRMYNVESTSSLLSPSLFYQCLKFAPCLQPCFGKICGVCKTTFQSMGSLLKTVILFFWGWFCPKRLKSVTDGHWTHPLKAPFYMFWLSWSHYNHNLDETCHSLQDIPCTVQFWRRGVRQQQRQ